MQKILIIDDDKFMVKVIQDCLKDGFEVISASDSTSGLEAIYQSTPDLILLDVVLPGMNGHEICRLLRNDSRTAHLPIIMLTSKGDTEDKVAGFEAGADDYITKPFAPPELIARVKTHLRRAKQAKSLSPLTGLPGNFMIEEEIKQRVAQNNLAFAYLYIDLDNFKAYNDSYGFLKGDEVLKLVAHIVEQSVKGLGNPDDFIGHIGGDDFIVITSTDHVEAICQEIILKFDSTIPLFYSQEDRKRGYIVTYDRQNVEVRFPLISISIAIVSNEHRPLENHWQVAEIASELKRYAKNIEGSIYVKDRRSR